MIKQQKQQWYNLFISNGFINEDKENAGISHLLEHVVTEGWKRCGKKGCTDYWKKEEFLLMLLQVKQILNTT